MLAVNFALMGKAYMLVTVMGFGSVVGDADHQIFQVFKIQLRSQLDVLL